MKPQFEDKEIINDEEDDLHINVKPFKKEKKSFKEKMKCIFILFYFYVKNNNFRSCQRKFYEYLQKEKKSKGRFLK